jgi:hypothetical protein
MFAKFTLPVWADMNALGLADDARCGGFFFTTGYESSSDD